MTSAAARWRWRLVRRRRFRRAVAALCDRRAEDARLELLHTGAVGDESVETLSAIATVMASPSLPNADRCVTAIEHEDEGLDPELLSVTTAVLQDVLWQRSGDRPEYMTHVAQLTDRLMRVTGPLPWGHYNLALHSLRADEFGAVAAHLASGAIAPSGGWPPSLLGAACAAVLGDVPLLSRSLAEPVTDPAFTHDQRFLAGVRAVFERLRDDRPIEATALGEVFAGPTGLLTRTIPQLVAVKTLLADAVNGVPPRTGPANLGGSAWGRWLCDRLLYAGGEAVDVLASCAPAAGDEPAPNWQRLGSQQDLLPLLAEQTARTLRQDLVDVGEHAADTAWRRLVELRVGLAGGPTPSGAAAARRELARCPWWPADGVLQTAASLEGEVERCYLEGRWALRRGDPAEAGRWFGDARARIDGAGMATALVALRFLHLLDYWRGVALAHLGQADEAAWLLRTCANGVKAREARAQLGLLAVADGDHAEAEALSATIPEPRPASADYLTAILASRDGNTVEAARVLECLARREPVAGVYVAAGHRLRGRMQEAAGEVGEAARWYRRALTHRPEDAVAAARLARVWLRRRYDDADVPPESRLDGRWSVLCDVPWAASLPLVRDCLDCRTPSSGRELLNHGAADPALRLLVLRTAVAMGEEAGAAEAVQGWVEDDDPDQRLVLAAAAARAGRLIRDFCLAGGEGPARLELADLERRLTESTDQVTVFWAATARLMLNPASLATAAPLPAMDDESLSPSIRLFAGLMSVFSEDPAQRRIGADRCRAALETGAVQEAGVRGAVRCLATDALGDDREFLAAYSEVETQMRVLPCDPVAGYLAATEARLRVGDIDAVVDGFIPDELADLAHSGVRRAMAVAYARRAVAAADRDPRAALRDVEQARELLGEAS